MNAQSSKVMHRRAILEKRSLRFRISPFCALSDYTIKLPTQENHRSNARTSQATTPERAQTARKQQKSVHRTAFFEKSNQEFRKTTSCARINQSRRQRSTLIQRRCINTSADRLLLWRVIEPTATCSSTPSSHTNQYQNSRQAQCRNALARVVDWHSNQVNQCHLNDS